jgi:peroxiredoxin
MNPRIFPAAVVAATFVFTACGKKAAAPAAIAQAQPADPAPAAPAAEAPPSAEVTTQLKALIDKVREKLAGGEISEAALAEELKGFDALLAANRGNKSDAVAQVLFTKASVYFQVLEDYDRTVEVLQRAKVDFEGTRVASQAEAMLQQIESQKDMLRAKAALKPGAAFPEFAAKDLAGAPISVAKFRGKVVLIDFWATWCGPCVEELPNVLAAYAKYHDKGFEIVGVSLDHEESALKAFLTERKMTWPQIYDGKGWRSELAQKYYVNSIPATYLLDRDGKIVAKNLRGAALEAQIGRLLNP